MGFAGVQEAKVHEGAKPAQVAYLKDGKLLTTGFSKMSERQYALWDEVSHPSPLHWQHMYGDAEVKSALTFQPLPGLASHHSVLSAFVRGGKSIWHTVSLR